MFPQLVSIVGAIVFVIGLLGGTFFLGMRFRPESSWARSSG